MFQILIDTGGTFTDCIATTPNGQTLRTKVLSSGFLRGQVIDFITDNQIQINHNWDFDTAFLVGFSFRIVGQSEFVKIEKIEGDIWTLSDCKSDTQLFWISNSEQQTAGTDLQSDTKGLRICNPQNVFFEITSHEEAPILATRIVTQTPVNQPFPALQMRLGTTKGTNALLERKGAKVALFVTKGFKDLLRIGTQQRPNLFQLAIPEPTLLYDQVIEVDERLDAEGKELQELRMKNEELRIDDGDSIAISLLHSYKNPIHEQELQTLIQSQNLKSFLSLSSSLSPSINYLRRTQTAVVNAYLQPILSDYLNNITQSLSQKSLNNPTTQSLSQTPLSNPTTQSLSQTSLSHSVTQSLSNLLVMNSAGGLVKAERFNAKDSLLSGPAGGMVGAAAIAQRLGFERCLTFDMGGTSTDTARFDGRLDLQFVTKIDGIELHNPTLAIETVAAGGGSICSFDGQKLRVGSESAGANPGPACYGSGGPLTITDVNLLLGKLDASRFGIPVQIEKSKEALQKIRLEMENELWKGSKPFQSLLSDDELLKGFEQIANEKMAEAIRRISVARGFDPKEYPLLAFGGAGGLHGCQLAEILGIQTVILPYDAGLLSAYGMGQARIERIASRQILQNLDEVNLETIFSELIEQAQSELKKDGIMQSEVYAQLVYLRFKGQENTIEIDCADCKSATTTTPIENQGERYVARPDFQSGQIWLRICNPNKVELGAVFHQKFKQLYGYCPDNLTIEVESMKVIVGEMSNDELGIMNYELNTVQHRTYSKPLSHSITQLPSIHNWDELRPQDTFDGPAILLNATSTSYIPDGWRVVVMESRDVVVCKVQAPTPPKGALSTTFVAPFRGLGATLFTNRFMAIAEEMGEQLRRTAFSVNVKERLDFSCALLDDEAELLVNAPHIPVHLGSLGICARLVLEKLPLNAGDVIITNHPKYGGSHLPDVTLLAGVFTADNQLIGYAINRAHHAEIGGKTPGSMPPDATNLAEEGVVILPTYLVKNGEIQWAEIERLFTQNQYPTRALTENIADITAALASLKSGETALQKLVVQHGLETVRQYMKLLKTSTSEALQLALEPFKNQILTATESMDDGREIRVAIELSNLKDLTTLTFDFTGTSARHPNNLNANVSIIYSAILYVLRLLVNKDIPLNEGLMQGVKVILPDDSFLHPRFTDNANDCPAVVGGNTEVSQRLTDTLLKAFGLAACSQGTMNNFLFGNESGGYYETICGGTGATDGHNGRSAVHQHMTNTRITDPEELERRYAVRLNRFEIRKKSGGKGKFSGGDGVVREIEFLDKLKVTLISQHRNVPPYGMAGGEAGKTGKQTLIKKDGTVETLAGITSFEAQAHDRIVIETPGGGGWGEAS
jgi:5-oxoprolinase (ATP-hydrolysing)